ncbi:acyl carrier protein [Parvibaculum sp.]|jgi:acyl carrier protein|uniref:acyl carrier protein n=1 Tax=Parvibaculum sp. TaxID=2024848 RepID=UPI001B2F3659|nr:acyl carrier protein [Parvibaculum sp.]MBO6634129.1 acyl carrier protein [Parvibaculum sp.]MBO6677212.1 acyl carrier protein [Parvibaculum sp.]MBO6685055.1 acyl carrier protein [Parvibaculum sp.]MBO6904633.1 acyl carrier protein [Parvibaculum sp.]
MTRDEIYETLKGFLVELFEIPEEQISLDAHLADDLDLDSIDAVDLILKLQEFIGRKVSAEQFRSVRTVRDVIDQVNELLEQAA